MTTLVLAGLGVAGAAFAGRFALQAFKKINWTAVNAQIPKIPTAASFNSHYKGGFDSKMSKREASLILGVSASASKTRLRDAHRRIMLVNHPDKGGSPYLASKINEAKDIMEGASKAN